MFFNHQWEGLSHILWKISHVPNHQPVWVIVWSFWVAFNIWSWPSSPRPAWSGNPPTQASLMSKLAWKPGLRDEKADKVSIRTVLDSVTVYDAFLEGKCRKIVVLTHPKSYNKRGLVDSYFQIQFKYNSHGLRNFSGFLARNILHHPWLRTVPPISMPSLVGRPSTWDLATGTQSGFK